jgi:23S rRNA pseudouridine2605 synthase
MRLQVFLSHAGVSSRRKALEIIQSGQVIVNGHKVTEPSFDVDPAKDTVVCNGQKVGLSQKIYILLHKPEGVVSTVKDRFAEKTVIDLLPVELRGVYPVGRLDKDSTGLLVLTNDGPLAHRLSHPSFETEKEYRVFLNRPLTGEDRRTLEAGVMIEGERTAPCRIKIFSDAVIDVILHEGRKRQIRRMLALFRYHVVSLQRIRQGFLTLGDLAPGAWRLLTPEEIKKLTALHPEKKKK